MVETLTLRKIKLGAMEEKFGEEARPEARRKEGVEMTMREVMGMKQGSGNS